MRILIDIGHPGHVHLIRNLYHQLKNDNHQLWVTVKDIPIAHSLLDKYQIPFINIGKKKDSIIGKALTQVRYNLKLLKLVKQYKIEMAIGTSISIAHISKLSSIKSIILDDDDDEVQPLFVKFAHPFADLVLSPESVIGHRGKKDAVFYAGFHELAYLHPNWFSPDIKVLNEIGLTEKDVFFVMRFNVFKAHHDVGIKGLNIDQKLKLIQLLQPYGKVFITTEREIEPELKEYQLPVSPEKIHSFMYYATMFLGDSQTMTSEAAVLGTPALKCNTFAGRLSIPNEIEKTYNLCYSYLPQEFDNLLSKINELLRMPNLKQEWQKRRQIMLKDKIDVTAFLVWFVENYPESFRIMKENPDYQYRFK